MEEHRQFVRLKKHFIVIFRKNGGESPFETTQTLDISLDGMAFPSVTAFELGTILEMSVNFPFRFGEKITIHGYVMFCKEVKSQTSTYRIGVRFNNLKEDLENDLALFIERFKE